MIRILFSLMTLLGVVMLPYWIYLPLLLIGVIIFPFFWEGILLGLLADALFGPGFSSQRTVLLSVGFYALTLNIVLLPVREKLRHHA